MREQSVGLNLTANTLTTVYTVPVGYYAKWNLLYVFNGTGSTKTFTAYWHDSSENADIYVEDTLVPASAVNKVKKAVAKKSTPKQSTKKSTSTSTPKTSKLQSSSSSQNNTPELQSESKSSSLNIWPWLLGVAGIATIGYAIYEYRTEIQLFIKKLRRN